MSTTWTIKELMLLQEKYPAQGGDIPELGKTKRQIYSGAKYYGVERKRPVCKVPTCNEKYYANGYCKSHYYRVYYVLHKEDK